MTTARRMMLYLVYSATTFSKRALNLQWSKPVKVGALTCFGHPGAHSAWAPGCPCISRRRSVELFCHDVFQLVGALFTLPWRRGAAGLTSGRVSCLLDPAHQAWATAVKSAGTAPQRYSSVPHSHQLLTLRMNTLVSSLRSHICHSRASYRGQHGPARNRGTKRRYDRRRRVNAPH